MSEQTQARYVIAENWRHIFDEAEGGRDVRFVYDRDAGAVTFMQVGTAGGWTDADAIQRDDVTDSLATANADALEDVSAWGLTQGDDVPEWAASPSGPGPR